MFTAKIIKVENNKINFNVIVEIYKDGVLFDTVSVDRINPLSSVYGYIKTRIENYKIIDETDTSSIIGDIDLNTLEPTSAEKNKREYEILVMKRLQMENEIKAGAFAADAQQVQDLEVEIKIAYSKL